MLDFFFGLYLVCIRYPQAKNKKCTRVTKFTIFIQRIYSLNSAKYKKGYAKCPVEKTLSVTEPARVEERAHRTTM